MKRTLLLGACLATLLLAGRAQAQTVTVDGIVYDLNTDRRTATVSDYLGNAASVSIPATVEYEGVVCNVAYIGVDAFHFCTTLESVVIPKGVTQIRDNAFYGCKSLRNVELPEGMETFYGSVFGNCTALVGIDLPESLTGMGYNTFDGCTSLRSIVVPSGVTEIGSSMFYGCTALEEAVLPDGATNIGSDAFYGCTSMRSIVLPAAMQMVGMRAFEGCPLADVHCLALVPPIASYDTFDATAYENATLHVPAGTADAYREAEGWKEFRNIAGDAANSISAVGASGEPLARYADGVVAASGLAAITVYDANGARVLHAEGVASLSLESLPGGIYVVDVAQGGQRQVLKVAR